MMISCDNFQPQIWGNGKDLGILWGESGYILENALLRSLDVNVDTVEVTTRGDDYPQFIPGLQTVNLDITGGKLTVFDREDILRNLDLFQNLKIRDLFREINKKIDKR